MQHACYMHAYIGTCMGALNMHVLYIMLKIIVPLLVRTYMYATMILYYITV